MLQLNTHQQFVLFENLEVILQYFHMNCTVCNALTLALLSVNKQKNNERYSQLMYFQCSQHKQFYSYIVRCSHYFFHHLYGLQVHVSHSGIIICCLGWGCQSPNPQEIQCFKWEFCVRIAWFRFVQCFLGMCSWHEMTPACNLIFNMSCFLLCA